MAESIEDWYRNMPWFTKFFVTAAVIVTFASSFGLLGNPMFLVIDYERIFYKLEIWRLVTGFLFFGKLGMGFIIDMVFMSRHSAALEKESFGENRADYMTMIFSVALTALAVNYFLDRYILGGSLVMSVIYIWSRRNYDQTVTFFFGFQFKAAYFPFVLIGFDVLLGADFIPGVIGAGAGHLYHYLVDIYPIQSGRQLLTTPNFMRKLFPQPDEQYQGPGVAERWGFSGSGQRLGRNRGSDTDQHPHDS